MLTFDGKALNFEANKAKEPANKEVSPNRFQVELLYKVHRQRVLAAKPTIASYVEIPDFLTNTDWKEQAKLHKQQKITAENETIYRRISRAENAESHITKENREHIERVEHELVLMERLKRMGRARNIIRINKENEDMLMRIERARPEYTQKALKDWYKHHELFKKGRKSDPTAGHLGFRGMRGLMPTLLPPVEHRSNLELAVERAEQRRRQEERGGGLSPQKLSILTSFSSEGDGPDSTSSSVGSYSPHGRALASLSSPVIKAPAHATSFSSHTLLPASLDSDASYVAAHQMALTSMVSAGHGGSRTLSRASAASDLSKEVSSAGSDPRKARRKKAKKGDKKGDKKGASGLPSRDSRGNSRQAPDAHAQLKEMLHAQAEKPDTADAAFAGVTHDPDHVLLLTRLVMVPFESITIIMQVRHAHAHISHISWLLRI